MVELVSGVEVWKDWGEEQDGVEGGSKRSQKEERRLWRILE